MALGLAFSMKKIKHDKSPIVKACAGGEINEVKSSTIFFAFSANLPDYAMVILLEPILLATGGEVLENNRHIAFLRSPIAAALLEFRPLLGGKFHRTALFMNMVPLGFHNDHLVLLIDLVASSSLGFGSLYLVSLPVMVWQCGLVGKR